MVAEPQAQVVMAQTANLVVELAVAVAVLRLAVQLLGQVVMAESLAVEAVEVAAPTLASEVLAEKALEESVGYGPGRCKRSRNVWAGCRAC